MKSIHNVLLIALTALILAVLMTAPAHSETGTPKKPVAAEKAKKAKKKGSAPKFVNSSSQESTAERDRRLYRECKGRPNAGACSGYAG